MPPADRGRSQSEPAARSLPWHDPVPARALDRRGCRAIGGGRRKRPPPVRTTQAANMWRSPVRRSSRKAGTVTYPPHQIANAGLRHHLADHVRSRAPDTAGHHRGDHAFGPRAWARCTQGARDNRPTVALRCRCTRSARPLD